MIDIKKIDEVVCQWTIDTGTPLTEKALNDLVDRIANLFGVPIPVYGEQN